MEKLKSNVSQVLSRQSFFIFLHIFHIQPKFSSFVVYPRASSTHIASNVLKNFLIIPWKIKGDSLMRMPCGMWIEGSDNLFECLTSLTSSRFTHFSVSYTKFINFGVCNEECLMFAFYELSTLWFCFVSLRPWNSTEIALRYIRKFKLFLIR